MLFKVSKATKCGSYRNILCPPEVGRSTLKFTHVELLLRLGEDDRLASVMKSATCLMTIAETGNSDEISLLVDFISGLKVRRKQLLVVMPFFNETSFLNKTINYNVIIMEKGTNYLDELRSYLLIICFQHRWVRTDKISVSSFG